MADKKTPKKQSPRPAGTGAEPGRDAGGLMDVDMLAQLMRLMADNDLSTVDLRDGSQRVILRRGQAVMTVAAGTPAPAGFAAPAPQPAATPPAAALPAAAAAADDPANLVPIPSPMPGTFYTAPKPGAPPFVSVGSRVVKDETDVCVIEAMKTFNTHKADVTGTIVKILVQNGQTVQFDQPLFLVKPD